MSKNHVVTVLRLEFFDTDIGDLRLDDLLRTVARECKDAGLPDPVLTRGSYLLDLDDQPVEVR